MNPALSCPGCGTAMASFEQGATTVEVCPQCKGLWLDRGELERLVGGERGMKARADRALALDDDGARRCPRCGSAMEARSLAGALALEIDVCGGCAGTFLDRGELDRVRKLSPPAQKTVLGSGEQSPTLRLALLLSDMEGVRTRRRLGAGDPMGEEEFGFFHLIAFAFGLPVKTQTIHIFPWATCAILALLVVSFGAQFAAGDHGARFLLRPSDLVGGARPWTLVTSMFMHGGALHLLGNAYYLHLFGGDVEARLGRRNFLLLYLVAGVGAGAAWCIANAGSEVAVVGASGAISGVIAAYAVLAGGQKILFRFRFYRAVIPDYVFIGIWLVTQLLGMAGGAPRIAWFAHLAGFAIGLLAAALFRASSSRP